MRKRGILRAIGLAGLLLAASACGEREAERGKAEGFEPTRPVTMVVPFAPGGGSDVFARSMVEGIQQVAEGVEFAVENRPGGSGAIGYSYLLQHEGDPHFLLAGETSGVSLPITTDVEFTWQDFTPVMQVADDAVMAIVRPDSPYRTWADAVETARGGQRVTVAITGATGPDAIVVGLTEQQAGVKFERVVFESGGELVNALLGGDVDVAMLNPSEVIGQLDGGALRAIVVFAEERYQEGTLTEVPTAREQGLDVVFTQYRGVFAAGGISQAEARYWQETVAAWTGSPHYQEFIKTNYLVPTQRTGDDFASFLTEYEQTLRGVLEPK